MFKKVLLSISKSLGRQSQPSAPATRKPLARPPADTSAAAPARTTAPAQNQTAEDLLGIDAKMGKEQIRDHLKLLYRRYNRAASSLDHAVRSEADSMLDAIVAVREKHFGEI